MGLALLASRGAVVAGVNRSPRYPSSYALSPPAVAVAADGTPHLLYPSPDDSMRHAWIDSGRWRDELVDPRLVGTGPLSIATDAAGRPHIVFTSLLEGMLVHGVRNSEGWTMTGLAPSTGLGSVAMGPGDHPVVVHQGAQGSLEVLTFDGTDWTSQDTGLDGPSTHSVDLVVDSTGDCHTLFHRSGSLLYATNSAGTWLEVAISVSPYVLGSLVLDAEGRPHAAVSNAGTAPNGTVLHLWNDGSGWQSEQVLPADEPFPTRYVRGLGIDDAGHLFIAHTDARYVRGEVVVHIRLAHHDGTGWRRVPSGTAVRAELGSFALGADGALHFACAGVGVLHVEITLPDLESAWTSVEEAPAGEAIRIAGTLRVANLGAGRSAPTRIEYYLSDDDLFDPSDERVGRARRLDFIRPDRERSFPVSLTLPATAAGRYLLAVVDPDARRDDIDRPNNTAAVLLGD